MKRLVLTFAILIGLAAPAWAGFAEGVLAYGRGDYATALREFRPLAEQGDAAAQYNLGLMYDEGQGVPQDFVQAYMWFSLAASRFPSGGRKEVLNYRGKFATHMTPAQIAKAERLAGEWMEKRRGK